MKTLHEKYLELALGTIQTELLEAYTALTVILLDWGVDDGDEREVFTRALRSVNTAISVATEAQKRGGS